MAQGILSKFIGGAATAGAKLYEQEAKTKRQQLLWELRTKETRAYNEGQRDEDRAFNIDQANIKMLSNQDREDELDLETEDMRLLNLKEKAEIRKNTRLQNIKDQEKLQDRRWERDALVKTNFGGYGSQEKFDARIEKLADIKFGDKFDSLSESTYKDLTGKVIEDSNHWLKARSEYMSKVKNEIIDKGYKTIADWEQRDRKPKTGTPLPNPKPNPKPNPNPNPKPDAMTGATQGSKAILNIRKRQVVSGFEGLLDFQKDNYIGALLSKLNKETLSPEELSSLEKITGVKMKDKSSIGNAIKEISGMSADKWKEKLRKK